MKAEGVRGEPIRGRQDIWGRTVGEENIQK